MMADLRFHMLSSRLHGRIRVQLSEVSAPRRLFQGVVDRIGRLSPAPS